MLNQLIENIKHGPSTVAGLFFVVLAALPQVPGFNSICQLSPAAGQIITYISGIAGLVLILVVGKKPDPNLLKLLIFGLVGLGLASGSAMAQTTLDPNLPTTMFGLGIGLDQQATSNLIGSGFYSHQVKDTVYWFTGYDALALPGASNLVIGGKTLKLPTFKFVPFAGPAFRLVQLTPHLSLWQAGTAGVAMNGNTVTGSFGMEAFLRYVFKTGPHGLVLGGRFTHDGISGDGFSGRFYYNWGK